MFFEDVSRGPTDPVYILKNAVDADTSPNKVDLGVGVYRNEQAQYHELQAIAEAKAILSQQQLGHDYEVTTGNADFVQNAAGLLFGTDADAIFSRRITSVQAISGTGSIHLAALFLSRCTDFKDKKVYIGTPAWGNYEPLFNIVGLDVVKYRYYDGKRGVVDFSSVLNAVEEAPQGSIFVLQGCCHNPSGLDLSQPQWRDLAAAMKQRNHFPFFDMAYQGLGGSLGDDAYGLRYFERSGFDLLACQSFSKNFGLYGERCGVLHVVSGTEKVASNVYDQLRCLIRWEFSSSPAYGARLVNIILSSKDLVKKWTDELEVMRERLSDLRQTFHRALVLERQTPGNWGTVLSSTGLFCFLPLSAAQCSELATVHHIHMLQSGRINVSGLNAFNIDRIASSIDQVARGQENVSARL
ncbi:aspartate aminotransferase [Phaeosphaeria sp. MPI-PUGE-AT-0046c]|nr:aspartate aminotransferase [Phaeosphaeria sp. MPI-PUGE-AT-0046c]